MADQTLKFRGADVTEAKTIEEKYFVVLRDYVSKESTYMDARDAAQSIDRLTPSPQNPINGNTDPEESLYAFWNALFGIVSQIPADEQGQHRHRRLVLFVRALLDRSSGTVTIYGAEKQMWKDLPLMGPVLRENWTEADEQMSEEKLAEWVNKNAFLALLLNTKLGNNNWLFEFPIWTLRGGLEENLDSPIPRHVKTRIAAGAQWFKYAAEFLLVASVSTLEDQDESFKRVTAPGNAFSGSGGLNLERWTFWKSRFEYLAGAGQDERVKALAKEAADAAAEALAKNS